MTTARYLVTVRLNIDLLLALLQSEPTDTILASAPEDAPALVKKIDKTTYKIRVLFSQISTETMSDKIKRILKHEIQQM